MLRLIRLWTWRDISEWIQRKRIAARPPSFDFIGTKCFQWSIIESIRSAHRGNQSFINIWNEIKERKKDNNLKLCCSSIKNTRPTHTHNGVYNEKLDANYVRWVNKSTFTTTTLSSYSNSRLREWKMTEINKNDIEKKKTQCNELDIWKKADWLHAVLQNVPLLSLLLLRISNLIAHIRDIPFPQ